MNHRNLVLVHLETKGLPYLSTDVLQRLHERADSNKSKLLVKTTTHLTTIALVYCHRAYLISSPYTPKTTLLSESRHFITTRDLTSSWKNSSIFYYGSGYNCQFIQSNEQVVSGEQISMDPKCDNWVMKALSFVFPIYTTKVWVVSSWNSFKLLSSESAYFECFWKKIKKTF